MDQIYLVLDLLKLSDIFQLFVISSLGLLRLNYDLSFMSCLYT